MRGEGEHGEAEHGERGFVALADDEQVVAALPLEDGFGRSFDRVRRAEPAARRGGGSGGRRGVEHGAEEIVFADVGGGVALEDDGAGIALAAVAAARSWTLSSHSSRSSSGSQTTWKGLLPSIAPAASL